MSEYYEFRCQKCGRVLAKVKGDTEINCPSCGGKNQLDFKSNEIKYKSKLRKINERTSSSGVRFN